MPHQLTLEALEVLDAIDRKGSFAAAAASLYRVPSAVTYSVQKLEQDLGVPLFRRQGRRSVLTPAGRVLLEQGRDLLEAAERLVETTRQVSRGWESRLNMAVDSICAFDAVYPHIAAFHAVQPDVEINLYEEVLNGAWEAVMDGRADLVIGAPEPATGMAGVSTLPLPPAAWVFAVAPQHPLAGLRRPLNDADIRAHRAVVVRDSSRHMPPLTRRVLDRQPVLRVASMQQKIAAQCHGLGVGFLPRQRIGPELAGGQLIALPLQEPAADTPLCLAWRSHNKGRGLRWFIDRLRETMG